ncbi:hypothetical protein [Flavobacterium algicola]|uniref:hypothetical protein n=1 Tax=Flavobacterium algicola TaxID=556529 RepID=UPI001EFD15A5|nr:hypothetical protein [Flavobacterium algicola]MCG9791187.1 hypothetical protein [Flavobacterium algicola]
MAAYKDQNTQLDQKIANLEIERNIQRIELKNQLLITYESVKPLNILKETLSEINHSPETKVNVAETALSLAGGYFSKKLIMGKSNSFFKKILGYGLQYGVTKLISKKVHSHY